MIHFLSKLHISDMARIVYIFCELEDSGRGPLAILMFAVHDLYIVMLQHNSYIYSVNLRNKEKGQLRVYSP